MGVTLAHAYGAHVPFVHVPLPLAAGAALGRALPDLVRTQFEGQGQALLYGPDLLLVSTRRVQLNEHRWLRGEPRIAQLVRLRHRKLGVELAVGNVHADPRGAPAQLEKAGFVLERFARGAPMILGGDLNAGMHSAGLRSLVGRGWVEDAAEVGIDHLLVRGARARVAGDALAPAAPRRAPERVAPAPALGPRPRRRGGGACLTGPTSRAVAGCAYLNAGTNGPLPRAAAEAMAVETEAALSTAADRRAGVRAVLGGAGPGAGGGRLEARRAGRGGGRDDVDEPGDRARDRGPRLGVRATRS